MSTNGPITVIPQHSTLIRIRWLSLGTYYTIPSVTGGRYVPGSGLGRALFYGAFYTSPFVVCCSVMIPGDGIISNYNPVEWTALGGQHLIDVDDVCA